MTINTFASRVSSTNVVASDSENAAMLIERIMRNAGVNLAKEVSTTGSGQIVATVATIVDKQRYIGYIGFELDKGKVKVYISGFATVADVCQNLSVSDTDTAVKVYKDMKSLKLPRSAELLEFSSVFASFYKDQVSGANAALRAFKDAEDKKTASTALKAVLATFKSLSVSFTRLAKKVKN